MVKKVVKRGRPPKKACHPNRVKTAGPSTATGSGSRTRPGPEPGSGSEPCLFPCPLLRRISNDLLPRMGAVLHCKDEEAGLRILGAEDLDALQLELESLLSSVVVRLCQLNDQLTALNGLEKVSQGRGRKQRKSQTVIPAPAPAPAPPTADDKPSRPPVKIPFKKLSKVTPPVPSPSPVQTSSKLSKVLRKRPDAVAKNKSHCQEAEKDVISHKFWNTLDPYCCQVTEDTYNILSDILCRNQTDVPFLLDIPPLGEHFSKLWDLKDFGENQDVGAASLLPSSPSSPNTSTAPSSESIGSAIRRKFRECSIALKRTLCTSTHSDKVSAPASPPPTPATSKLMAALLGELPTPVVPLQESKDHNVILKIEKEDDEKPLFKTSRPNSVSGSSSNSELTRKHQRKCLDRKFRLEREAQGEIESFPKNIAAPQSLLDELKRTQTELKRVAQYNNHTLTNLTNTIVEEIKFQTLKRKLQEMDDSVIDIYHTRTAAKLAKQTISQGDVNQAWKALRERDRIIQQIDLCKRRWKPKVMANF